MHSGIPVALLASRRRHHLSAWKGRLWKSHREAAVLHIQAALHLCSDVPSVKGSCCHGKGHCIRNAYPAELCLLQIHDLVPRRNVIVTVHGEDNGLGRVLVGNLGIEDGLVGQRTHYIRYCEGIARREPEPVLGTEGHLYVDTVSVKSVFDMVYESF